MKIPTAAFALLPLTLGAVEVDLDFTIFPTSVATATYRIGTIPTQLTTIYSVPISYSGNLLATVDVDGDSGTIESFEFTGGSIVTPDHTPPVLDINVGSVPYKVQFATAGIRRTPESIVDPMTGNTRHTTVFAEGTMTTSNYSLAWNSGVFTYIHQVAELAPYLISPDYIFYPITLGSTPTSSDALTRSFTATFQCPINLFPQPGYTVVPVAGYPGREFTHDYMESGSFYAEATYTIPTAYGQWALDNGLTLTTGEEVNGAGMPYALLYAFDLPADAASLPITHSAIPTVTLTLPESGLGFPVRVEYTADPSTDFTPLPDENFVSGTDSLDAGATDPATLSYPAGAQGYLQFYAEL